jgi:micrococcal nuclease
LSIARTLAFVGCLGLSTGALAEHAVVRQVIDGDTIYACGSGCYTVRIANIDTPEMPPKAKCQREAELALQVRLTLALAIEGKTVELVTEKRLRDRYGRLLARVYFDGKDMGEELVTAGMARPWTGRRQPWC